MPETVNQEQTTNTQPAEKLFTQEQVNGFFDKRYSELMSELKEYKEKAAKYDEMEEAGKSELQKAVDRAEKLQKELNGMKEAAKVAELREKVAKETGIPADMLTYGTEEECRRQAERIRDYKTNINPSYPNVRDGGEPGGTVNTSTAQAFAEWFNQQ